MPATCLISLRPEDYAAGRSNLILRPMEAVEPEGNSPGAYSVEDDCDYRISLETQNAGHDTVKAVARFGLESGRLGPFMADACLKVPYS
eukprot:8727066-Pyramimonas_sp.AAC.1